MAVAFVSEILVPTDEERVPDSLGFAVGLRVGSKLHLVHVTLDGRVGSVTLSALEVEGG